MLVWINGAFGAGKTQTAFELHRRLRGSHVADPELIGFGIHKMLPASGRGDFQDRPQWRTAVAATLADAVAASAGPVIAPMTLVDGEYFDEIMSGLAHRGVEVRHFALVVSPEELRRRLRGRGYWIARRDSWALGQVDRCAEALHSPRFAEHIETDHLSIDEAVEAVAARADLNLDAGRLSAPRSLLRRAAVTVRHLRL